MADGKGRNLARESQWLLISTITAGFRDHCGVFRDYWDRCRYQRAFSYATGEGSRAGAPQKSS